MRTAIVASVTAVSWLFLPSPPVTARLADASVQSVSAFEVNGLKVVVKRRPATQTVAAGLFIRGGTQNLTAENAGIEALMLGVATEASANFPRERFRRELARTGTVIGSGVTYDYSAFTLACTRQQFDRAWAVFVDAALNPSFAPDDFERVRNRDLIRLSTIGDTPDAYLRAIEARVIYKGHPYANDPEGTQQSLPRLTVADMRRFHQQVMQTSRLLLVMVGDLDPQEIQRRVETSFGTLARGAYAPSAVPPLSFPGPSIAVTQKELPTTYVQGVYGAPPPSSPDIYPMRVATSILRSRIFNEVRLKRALSYAPDASLGGQAANVGSIYVTAVDVNQTVRVMLAEIARLRTTLVDPDEINATAQEFLTHYYMGQETNAAQTGSLAHAELLGGGWRTVGELLDRLSAVTPQAVRRVAETYMRNLQFVVLGNPPNLDRQIFLGQGGGDRMPVAAGLLIGR